MPQPNPFINTGNAYEERFDTLYLPEEEYEVFKLSMPDDRLTKMLIDSLDRNLAHWNKKPWSLEDTDLNNVKFYLGDQLSAAELLADNENYTNNRLFASIRAILSYATGQLAKPEIVPSKSDEMYLKMARATQMALYQHSADEQADQKFRAAVLNLLLRKRAYLKLRFDPNAGMYGDIVTEVCDPSDIIVDREAKYGQDPNVMYHRVRKSIDEWCAEFPKKASDLYRLFNFKKGTLNQLSRIETGFEGWYTYRDAKGIPRQGTCWFFHDPAPLVLDNIPNPLWVYTGNDKKDKETNVLFAPPKPFVSFNYLNMGISYIDETSLFEQAKPVQRLLNARLRQIHRNADLANGRWVYSKKAMDQSDAERFVSKGNKSILGVNAEDVSKSFMALTPNAFPQWAYNTVGDLRNEIDVLMGTPSVFRGANPESQDTLGRDMMLKQQAGMLQDDLVRCVQQAYTDYYRIKLQMMRVFYTDDYWFQVKGGDGKFDFVMLNGDTIDANVRIGVQVDSTLPLDKPMIRGLAQDLLKANKVDYLTAMQDLGLPDPEVRTERYLRSQIDPYTYMESVETQLDSNDAEVDIMLLKANRTPQERANYDEHYLNYFNDYLSKNEFTMLPQRVQERIVQFLQEVTQRAQRTAMLGTTQLNQAGIINRPPIFPLPKRTENIRINAMASPEDTHNLVQGEAQMFTPVTQAEQAQNPNGQASQQIQQAAPPNS